MLPRPAVLWLSAVLPLSAETYTFYVQQGTPPARYAKQWELVQRADPAADRVQRPLKDKSATMQDAREAAHAIRNGFDWRIAIGIHDQGRLVSQGRIAAEVVRVVEIPGGAQSGT